jgi:TM2 domain-containing membrane protein YozV
MADPRRKSLLLAWVLNVIPGIGLIYVGKTVSGIILMVIGALFLILCLTGVGAIIGLPLYLGTSLVACVASVIAASHHNKALPQTG